MATTDIKQFAGGGSANVMSQADWAALTSVLSNGFPAGQILPSNELNKVLRQAMFIAAGVAGYCVAKGINVPDDGDLAALVTKIGSAIAATTVSNAAHATNADNAASWTGSGGGTSGSPKVAWADNANYATNANHATSADNANYASTATNADYAATAPFSGVSGKPEFICSSLGTGAGGIPVGGLSYALADNSVNIGTTYPATSFQSDFKPDSGTWQVLSKGALGATGCYLCEIKRIS